jgi:GT2 family glycosyltransferase
MRMPEGVEPVFVLVENERGPTLSEVIDAFRTRVSPAEVIHEHEPRLGIPFARNRVLDVALRRGCDLLAFIDDDETADSRWLEELCGTQRRRGLDLVGGPVRVKPCPDDANAWERVIWKGLVHRFARIEAAALGHYRRGTDDRVTVVTNNWLADLNFIRRHGLRFDESIGFSGGSDTRFFRQARAAGARTGWAPQAFVHELWPRERLTAGYQYRRGRDQAIASFRNKHPVRTPWIVIRSVGYIVCKLVSFAVLLVFSLLDGGRSLVRALRALGFAAGRLRALLGSRSSHYARVQGG